MALKFKITSLFVLIMIRVQVYCQSQHQKNPSITYPFYSVTYLPPPNLIEDDSIDEKINDLASFHDIARNDMYQIYELLWQNFDSSPSDVISEILEKLSAAITSELECLQSPSTLPIDSQDPNPKLKLYLPNDSPEAYTVMMEYFDTQIPQLSVETKVAIENLIRKHAIEASISPPDAENLIYQLETCIRYILVNQDQPLTANA